jgi:integrase/recombinase XerC
LVKRHPGAAVGKAPDAARAPTSTVAGATSATGRSDAADHANAAWLDSFGQHLALAPARTREAYLRDAVQLAQLAARPLPALTRHDISRALARLHAQGVSGVSLRRKLSAWRAFFRFARERDASIGDDPCAGLRAPKAARRLPSALSPDEAARLVTLEGDDALAARDRALLELAYSSGLRLSELASLDVGRLDVASREVRVLGKGAKERVVPVGQAALDAVSAWLRARAALAPAHEPALFVGQGGSRLTPRAIQKRLAQWARVQGLGRHVHPHMLRHSFASHVLQSSGDLRAVQEMLGHASIASTQVYTHLDFQALARAYDAAHPRARRRKGAGG